MATMQLNLDQAYQIMLKLREFNDSYDAFTRTGTSVIREVDLKSEQQKKINDSMDLIEEKTKAIRETIDNVTESTMAILREIDGFNEQEAMKKVDELAEAAKKVEQVSVTRIF